eukprot:4638706-Amphidinium_carterae.1
MAPGVWLPLLALCLRGALAEDASEITFTLGIVAPFTSGIPAPLAAAVAFDLDFRKKRFVIGLGRPS